MAIPKFFASRGSGFRAYRHGDCFAAGKMDAGESCVMRIIRLFGSRVKADRLLRKISASAVRMQRVIDSIAEMKCFLSVTLEHQLHRIPAMPQPIEGRVAFHGVSLRYAPESSPALRDVNFEALPGQIVAIKGNNGSGKSSILKLIVGLHVPEGGSVRLDGIDI